MISNLFLQKSLLIHSLLGDEDMPIIQDMFRVFFSSILWLTLSPSVGAQSLKSKPRLSPSYQSVITCFPEFKSTDLESSFSIEKLKDGIDKVSATSRTQDLLKMWIVKDGTQRRRITLKLNQSTPKEDKVLSVEKLDDQNTGESVEIPSNHRVNPAQKVINIYLYKAEILDEETEKIDTKLNGFKNRWKRQGSEMVSLEIHDTRANRKVRCEQKKNLGAVCFCEKK